MLSAEMLIRVLNCAPDAMLVVDPSGSIVFLSRQVSTLFGYEVSELEGQSVELLLPERLRQAHVAHRQDFSATIRVRHMGGSRALTARRKDGSEFPAEVSLSPIADGANQLVVVAVRDVSERSRAETAYRESE